MQTLGELQTAKCVTNESLAKLCGVLPVTVRHWVLGSRNNLPGKKNRKKLEEYFGCPILFQEKERKPKMAGVIASAATLSHAVVVHANPDGDIVYDYSVKIINKRHNEITRYDVEAVRITSGDRAGER